MSANLLHALVSATLISSVAVLVIAILRKPVRAVFGARAAYWLWLLVPISTFAVMLPAPTPSLRSVVESMPIPVGTLTDAMTIVAAPQSSTSYVVAGLVIWLTGACLMLALLLKRQWAFVRSLGAMTPDVDDVRRSEAIVAPMVVGAWRPQLIVPTDFAIRYTDEEQKLILAHERAHLVRHDTSINALAALWLCFNWFNPLMYRALGLLRLDQELACDACVLAKLGVARRIYADALLKTQLATESAWRMPIGCYWQTHPLKERVIMLKRPLPGLLRRLSGVLFAFALTVSGSYAVWAAQTPAADNADRVEKMLQYSQCIRANGYAEFPDPSPDGKILIRVTDPKSGSQLQAAQRACKDKAPAGFVEQDQNVTPEQMQALLGFAGCMRKNGVNEFPDPSPNGVFEVTSPALDMGSLQFRQKMDSCRSTNPPGPLQIRKVPSR